MSESAPQSDTMPNLEADRLAQEFRDLCMLLTLATAINDPDCHPTLDDQTSASAINPQFTKTTILNAIATILVREHEILACMSHRARFVVATSGDCAPEGQVETSDPQGEKNEKVDEEIDEFYGLDSTLSVTPIANPMDDPAPDSEAGWCVPVTPGRDCWPDVKASESGWRLYP